MVLVTRAWRGPRSPPQRSLPVGGRIARPKYEGCGRQRQLGPLGFVRKIRLSADARMCHFFEGMKRTVTRAAEYKHVQSCTFIGAADQPTFIYASVQQRETSFLRSPCRVSVHGQRGQSRWQGRVL